MKKRYINPDMEVIITETEALVADSIGSDIGIGYGGVDNNGTVDPEVKENPFHFEWE